MNTLSWFFGYVVCVIATGSYERFMNMCRYQKIKLWDIAIRENRVTFSISIHDYLHLRAIAKKTRTIPHIIDKKGIPFFIHTWLKNWTLLIALFLFSSLLYLYSGFIWSIEVSGQREYTKESILETIREVSVYPGMKKNRLDCDAIETFLRKKYERLSWVSAEEVGSRLKIKIKEGTKTISTANMEVPKHLVSSLDGVVRSIITSKGTPLVKKNDTVKKGDYLIQGVIEIKGDNDEVIQKKPVCATGNVEIEGTKEWNKRYPIWYQKREYTGKNIRLTIVQWNEKQIAIKNPLKQFDKSSKYGIISKICYKNQNHFLGIDFTVYQRDYRSFVEKKTKYRLEQIKKIAARDYSSYLRRQEENGCVILSKKAELYPGDKDWLLQTSTHMIVPQKQTKQVRQEEWSVEDGTDDGDSSGT